MTYVSRLASVTAAFLVLIATVAVAAPAASAQEPEEDGPAIHYVIDVSGSMNGPNLNEAAAAVKESAAAIPDTTAVGLRSYAGFCDDPTGPALVRLGFGNDEAVVAAADTLRAGGNTPTTVALDRGMNELISFGSSGSKRLVLLTDGDNDCDLSICDYAKVKDFRGVDVELFTVGLLVSDEARQDLECAVMELGGTHTTVTTVDELRAAVRKATFETPPPPPPPPPPVPGPGDGTNGDGTNGDGTNGDGPTVAGPGASDAPLFTTHLFPYREVPASGGPAHGWSTWQLSADRTTISYRIFHSDLTGPITGAHLHQADASRNGPVVVPLDITGNEDGSFEGTFSVSDFVGPMEGRLMAGMVGAIEAGAIYVNLHTADQPSGAIRGQLMPAP